MPPVIAKKPVNRLFRTRTETGDDVGTEPITEQELGYWIRTTSQRSAAGHTPLLDSLREHLKRQLRAVVPDRPTSTQWLPLDNAMAVTKRYWECWAAFAAQPSTFDVSGNVLSDVGAAASASNVTLCINPLLDMIITTQPPAISAPINLSSCAAIQQMAGNYKTVQLNWVDPFGDSPPRLPDKEWKKLYEKMDSFTQLQDGWNSYSAKRPSTVAIRNAQEFLDVLCAANNRPSRLNASAVGGVGITFRLNDRKTYVEFLNGGSVYVLFSDGVAEPAIKEVRTGYLSYVRLIGDIRDYLNA